MGECALCQLAHHLHTRPRLLWPRCRYSDGFLLCELLCAPPVLAQAANGSKSIFVTPGLEEGDTDSEDEEPASARGSGASADLRAGAQAAGAALGKKEGPGSGRLSLFQAKAAASERLGAAQPGAASGEDFVIGTQAPIPAHQQAALGEAASPPFDAGQASSATLLLPNRSFFHSSLRRRTTSTPEEEV